MNVMAAFLHNQKDSVPGWEILHQENLDDESIKQLNKIFGKYVKEQNPGGYNTWKIITFGTDDIGITRISWDNFVWKKSIEEVESFLDNYYGEQK